jgi:hypothetical protein
VVAVVTKPALTDVERAALTAYERGWIDGLWAYAWFKDSVTYVGTTGTTYALAIDRFLRERGRR